MHSTWIALPLAVVTLSSSCRVAPAADRHASLTAELRSRDTGLERVLVAFDGEDVAVTVAPGARDGDQPTPPWRQRLSPAERGVLVAAIARALATPPPPHPPDPRMPDDYRLRITVRVAGHESSVLILEDIWDPRLERLAETLDAMLPSSRRLGCAAWKKRARWEIEETGRLRVSYPGEAWPKRVVGRILTDAEPPISLSVLSDRTWALTSPGEGWRVPSEDVVLEWGTVAQSGLLQGWTSRNPSVRAFTSASEFVAEGPIRVTIDGREIENR